jgi:hypothetical protein
VSLPSIAVLTLSPTSQKFATTKAGDACTQDGCVGSSFGNCNNGKFIAQQCAPGTT